MKIFLTATKDYNFYNFRKKFILKLLELKHDITLICPYGTKIDYFTKKGCKFINIDVDRKGVSIINDIKLLYSYYKILKKEKPDLMLTYTTKCSVYPGIICGLLNIKYIVNNAGLIEAKGILKILLQLLYKLGYRKASCMMYQNSQERDYFNKILKNKVRYRELPGSGVDLREFAFQKYPQMSEFIFNYVGRITKKKGIEEFLYCAQIIKAKYSNVQFIIYGDYDEWKYKEQIEELCEKGIVSYEGNKMDLRPYIKKCSALIHASYYEGMTNAVLEHSSVGRVCIGANIHGIKEAIEDGKTGFLFEAKNKNSLVKTVEKFLKLSLKEKENLGIAARKKMEEEFDRNIVTNIYLEEIENIEK